VLVGRGQQTVSPAAGEVLPPGHVRDLPVVHAQELVHGLLGQPWFDPEPKPLLLDEPAAEPHVPALGTGEPRQELGLGTGDRGGPVQPAWPGHEAQPGQYLVADGLGVHQPDHVDRCIGCFPSTLLGFAGIHQGDDDMVLFNDFHRVIPVVRSVAMFISVAVARQG
jgi:hypothetical protein